MKITEILKSNKPTISFEVFPPKQEAGLESVKAAAGAIAAMNPSFMSVTYGAGGSTSKLTVEVASDIKNLHNVPVMPHLTCVASTKEHVRNMISQIHANNIDNVMALRGDLPKDGVICNDYKHASDLIADIRSFDKEICIGGACYPEGHIESDSLYDDLHFMKAKQDMGASFLITQLFYDNNYYYRLLRVAKKTGITIPIIPGIMPLTNSTMFNRIMHMAGASIPFELRVLFDRFQNDREAMYEIGIAFSVNQILELLANDADGIHIYTMNNSRVAADIYQRIHHVIEKELR